MSGLARILAGRAPCGVYHWTSSGGIDDIRHAVERAHWRFVLLDTWAVEDKAGFFDACQQAFGFPEWFGRNFDALGDALSDVRPDGGVGDSTGVGVRTGDRDPEELLGVLMLWDGWGPLARAERRVFDVALDVLSARVEYERAGPFAVLLRGPGPDDTDLVELDPRGPRTA